MDNDLLEQLAESEGMDVDQMLEEYAFDAVVPAICRDCGATYNMEPDQTEGYCEECKSNTVVSCLILAGLI